MFMKDIYVFDLDGTIVINNKKVNELIINQLKKLQDNGASIIFATSRALRGIKQVIPNNFLANSLILCNGAFSYSDNKIIHSDYIVKDVCDNIVKLLEENNIEFYVELGDSLYIPYYVTHPFFSILKSEANEEKVFYNYHDVKYAPIYKIAIVENMPDYLQYSIESSENVLFYRHADTSADIVSKNCSKWNMLKKLLLDTNDYRVIAFGNDNNDIELLRNADLSIAVCPVNKQVSKAADIILNDNNAESFVHIFDHINRFL